MILVDQGDKKVYSDTEILEKEMLDIASQYPEDLSQDFICKDARYTVNNTFSSVRLNLLNWYNFKINSSLLEVGAGMGALTGLFCDRCRRVVSVEMSEKRAQIIRKRYPSRTNLEIISDDILTMELKEKFDYIVVVGVLEYASIFSDSPEPYNEFVLNLKRFLKNDGIILLAIENRFGIKYWCGASEDHICKPFVGINGYKENGTPRTFSKKELQDFFVRAGLDNTRFFYVLPDYKFPTVIFTDEYKPNASTIQKVDFSYVKGSALICNEKKLYKDIFENEVGDFFANSFLIEASSIPLLNNQPIYISSRGECKKEYRISTLIYPDGKVLKIPMHLAACEHIKRTYENEKKLTKRNINVLDYDLNEGKLVSQYFVGQSAEEKYHEYLRKSDRDALYELITLLKNNLIKSSDFVNAQQISKEENFFLIDETIVPILKDGFIDMTFSNSFYEKDELIFFDQEWCFPNVPLNFILYYAVRQSYLSYTEKTNIKLEDIFKDFGLSEFVRKFEEIERKIFSKILYRQDFLYNKDEWYNLFCDKILLRKQVEINNYEKQDKIARYEEEFDKKNAYIVHLEKEFQLKSREILNKNDYINSIKNFGKIEEEQCSIDRCKNLNNQSNENNNLENRGMIDINNEKKILRKIDIRNEAIKNLGTLESLLENEPNLCDSHLEAEISRLLMIVNEYSTITIHRPIYLNHQGGKARKIIKKVIRKIVEKSLGWYYFPVIENQNLYNQSCNSLIKLMSEIIKSQDKEIKNIKEEKTKEENLMEGIS